MRKLMVLFLMVTMVLGFSFSVFALTLNGSVIEGTVEDWEAEDVGPVELEVRAELGQYAEIEVIQNSSIFVDQQDSTVEAILSGEPGIYTNDGTAFGGMMEHAFAPQSIVHSGSSGSSTESNLAIIKVRTNAPLFIDYEWDGTNWFNDDWDVDTILAVFDRTADLAVDDNDSNNPSYGQTDFSYNQVKVMDIFNNAPLNYSSYVAAFGDVDSDNGANINHNLFSTSAQVLQNYQFCTARQYELVVGFNLNELCQARAGKYTGDVDVTISDLGLDI